jgi:hypothetical protein
MSEKQKALNNESNNNSNKIIAEKETINKGIKIIEDVFKEQKIFVCFNSKKAPCLPFAFGYAKTNNPNTWGSLEQALSYSKNANYIKVSELFLLIQIKGIYAGLILMNVLTKTARLPLKHWKL